MARTGIDERVWYELAPPLRVAGRPTAVAHLRELLQDPEPDRWTPARKDALRLGAVVYQVASRLIADLEIMPAPLTPRAWRPKLESGWVSVSASSLFWGGVEARNVRPLPATQAFLNDLTDAVVDRVTQWAPPVVMPFGREGEYWVVACHVPALLARLRRPDSDIRVRLLRGRVRRHRSLPEVCAGAVTLLGPLYHRYRQFLARMAVDDLEARLLTGYSRAQYFRLKEGRG